VEYYVVFLPVDQVLVQGVAYSGAIGAEQFCCQGFLVFWCYWK